jgi:hypothetical protein
MPSPEQIAVLRDTLMAALGLEPAGMTDSSYDQRGR